MGDNVIDDAQVIFELSSDSNDYEAGGSTGKVILNSVTLTIERPTNGYSGIGNKGEVAVGYGTRSASMDHEQMINERAAEMLADLYENDRQPKEASIIAGDILDMHGAKVDWNELEVDFQDDGDATISISAKVRGLAIDYTGS